MYKRQVRDGLLEDRFLCEDSGVEPDDRSTCRLSAIRSVRHSLFAQRAETSMPSSIRFQPVDAIRLLEATPAVLRSQLEHLDGSWIRNNYGPTTFSPYDIVRHLIHGERVDWIPRLRILIEHGESRSFDPYIIEELRDEGDDQSIVQLLDRLARLRHGNLETLRALHLTDQQWKSSGTHPVFGPVTASELVATWAVHDLNHIHQIAKCLGNQYRDEIGPWRKILTFIDR